MVVCCQCYQNTHSTWLRYTCKHHQSHWVFSVGPYTHLFVCVYVGKLSPAYPVRSVNDSMLMYHKLTKICVLFLHATLRQMWGGGVCSNILFILGIHPFHCSSQSTCGVDNHDGSLDEHVLQEINGTLVFTQDKSEQLKLSVVMGNYLE